VPFHAGAIGSPEAGVTHSLVRFGMVFLIIHRRPRPKYFPPSRNKFEPYTGCFLFIYSPPHGCASNYADGHLRSSKRPNAPAYRIRNFHGMIRL
jgi:hypothetical protein